MMLICIGESPRNVYGNQDFPDSLTAELKKLFSLEYSPRNCTLWKSLWGKEKNSSLNHIAYRYGFINRLEKKITINDNFKDAKCNFRQVILKEIIFLKLKKLR